MLSSHRTTYRRSTQVFRRWRSCTLHGYRTGYATGPYGIMRLNLARAEQTFVKLAGPNGALADDHQAPTPQTAEPADARHRPRSPYGPDSEQPPAEVHHDAPSI